MTKQEALDKAAGALEEANGALKNPGTLPDGRSAYLGYVDVAKTYISLANSLGA